MDDKTVTTTYTAFCSASGDRPKRLGLVVLHSESHEAKGSYPITGRHRIGRDASMDVVLADPKVSRHHADVEGAIEGVLVLDAASHNGTHVNGARIGSELGGTLAKVGSIVRLGKTLLGVVEDVGEFANYPPPLEGPLVGGPSLARIRDHIRIIAQTNDPVLVYGETGTGKERVAQALHQYSGRKGQLVAINCAAIPSELMESELFGYSKGAFSGSQKARPGIFRTAEGGTLLLDEIGELPLSLQAKLLRVLEDGQVRPVGEDHALHVDVRIVAATNRSLEEMSEEGTFRTDLIHRLKAVTVVLPPLRERMEDVPLLARYFLDDELAFSSAAMELLLAWAWPGNVRELRHVVSGARTTSLASGRRLIQVGDLPAHFGGLQGARCVHGGADGGDREAALRARIEQALASRSGNVAQVARDLAIRRPGLYEAFTRLGIDPAQYRKGRPPER